ncbi:MAG: hypothetical protein I8H76_11630 [Burkholderiales bacterium]|nr:hypothetical protein [Burkholderiales bacterium]MBH2015987.1 hypothetical protein [Burkholderiales bacterium]
MSESIQQTSGDVTSLARKSWVAYLWSVVLTLVALALTLPGAWQHGWMTALACGAAILFIAAYVILSLRAVHLYCDDVGVWVYSGVLPWNKGVAGVKWRDLDEAVYFQGPVSWALRSYRLRIGHRFTKSSEIILTKMWRGHEAVMTINSRHQDLIRSGQLM